MSTADSLVISSEDRTGANAPIVIEVNAQFPEGFSQGPLGLLEGLLVPGYQAHNFWRELAGHLPHFVWAPCRQRTGQDDYPCPRHTQGRRPSMGRSGEGAGYYTNRRHTLGLGYYRVVETPRSTGASIRDGVNQHVTFRNQGVESLVRARRAVAELGGINHFVSAVIPYQHLLKLPQERVCVILPVLQQSDHLPTQVWKLGLKPNSSGTSSAVGSRIWILPTLPAICHTPGLKKLD